MLVWRKDRIMIELIMAGDSSSYPDSTPGKMWNGGGVYLYPMNIQQEKGR